MKPFQPQLTIKTSELAVSIFAEWQGLREVQVPVLDCGGLFKDYDLHKVTSLSADIAEWMVCRWAIGCQNSWWR